MNRIPDYNESRVKNRELSTINRINRLIGRNFYIKKNPDAYGWDSVVYGLNKTSDGSASWDFYGYIELEHADRGSADAYKNRKWYPEWRLLAKKFFVKREDGSLSNEIKKNIDRCLYLKYTFDFQLSFIIPMDHALEVGVLRKNLKHSNGKNFYDSYKKYQQIYIAIDPDNFITEEGDNVLTKNDACIDYIQEFFSSKEPLKLGKKRRKVKE